MHLKDQIHIWPSLSQRWLLIGMVYTLPEWRLWCKLEKVIFLREPLEASVLLVWWNLQGCPPWEAGDNDSGFGKKSKQNLNYIPVLCSHGSFVQCPNSAQSRGHLVGPAYKTQHQVSENHRPQCFCKMNISQGKKETKSVRLLCYTL